MPQDWNYGTDRLRDASMGTGTEWRDSDRFRLLTSAVSNAWPLFPIVPLFQRENRRV
jgi:hypothetical protein